MTHGGIPSARGRQHDAATRANIYTRGTRQGKVMTFKIKRPRVDIRFQNKVQEIAVNRKELIYVFAQ